MFNPHQTYNGGNSQGVPGRGSAMPTPMGSAGEASRNADRSLHSGFEHGMDVRGSEKPLSIQSLLNSGDCSQGQGQGQGQNHVQDTTAPQHGRNVGCNRHRRPDKLGSAVQSNPNDGKPIGRDGGLRAPKDHPNTLSSKLFVDANPPILRNPQIPANGAVSQSTGSHTPTSPLAHRASTSLLSPAYFETQTSPAHEPLRFSQNHGSYYPDAQDPPITAPCFSAPSAQAASTSAAALRSANVLSPLSANESYSLSAPAERQKPQQPHGAARGRRTGLVDTQTPSMASEEHRYRPYPEIYTTSHSQQGAHASAMSQRAGDLVIKAYAPSTKEEKKALACRRSNDATQRRRRRTQACEYCHLKKVKCEGDGTRCNNCVKNDVQCTWGQKRKRGPKPKPGTIVPGLRVPKGNFSQQLGERHSPASSSARPSSAGSGMPISMILRASAEPMPLRIAAADDKKVPASPCAAGELSLQGLEHKGSASDLKSMATTVAPTPMVTVYEGGHDYGFEEDDEGTSIDISIGLSPQSNDSLEGLRAPRMDSEMEEFFSDRIDAETRDTVRYYFDFFYPLCPMFHPSMFIRRLVRGQVDPLLIDAMKAASARVVTKMTGRFVDGPALAHSVKQRILVQLETPTIDLVQVLVIMTLLSGSQGEYVSYNSLICLAASLVVRLGWHKLDLYKRPPPDNWEDWVQLEVKRRVFWLVYQTDSYQAMLTGRPMSIAEDSVYVSAPCSDYEWDVIMHPGSRTQSLQQHLQQQQQSELGKKDTKLRLLGTNKHHRSSRSSSGSAASLAMPSLRVDQSEVVATGAFSHSFMLLCGLTAIIARANSFICDAKASRPSSSISQSLYTRNSSMLRTSSSAFPRDGPFPAVDFMHPVPEPDGPVHPIMRTVTYLSEYPAFIELEERLEDWKSSLLMPEDLRDDATEASDISYFGNADHRRFMMRVRYFCLHCYYVPIAIFLHQSNRPSFFTEYELPLDMRLQRQQLRQKGEYKSPTPEAEETEEMPFDKSSTAEGDVALREMLNMAFASTWNEGILAYDVEPRSWRVCVRAAHGLSEHLERNSDFPLERFDQIIPFCIFMSVSVLIRQVHLCDRMLASVDPTKDPAMLSSKGTQKVRRQLEDAGGASVVSSERALCVKHVRHQWETLQSLGSLWDVQGMQALLKSMQVDEVTKAADMLSEMCL
ncbi:hypothetical protein GGI07_002474 [Coemansia sp. Benny D115]|nr:hypothetical protein GGI07_002474 [Coemansia sp. Benny D115]